MGVAAERAVKRDRDLLYIGNFCGFLVMQDWER